MSETPPTTNWPSDHSTRAVDSSASPLDVRSVRADFPFLERAVNGHPLAYLDNAASTQKPQAVLDALPDGQCLRLPMKKGNRSLNLSNAAAVVVYEAWRQLGFAGGA